MSTEVKMLTVADIAKRRGVKEATIRRYHHDGRLPKAKQEWYVGRTPQWPEPVIDEWEDSLPGQGWRKGIADGTSQTTGPTVNAKVD